MVPTSKEKDTINSLFSSYLLNKFEILSKANSGTIYKQTFSLTVTLSIITATKQSNLTFSGLF